MDFRGLEIVCPACRSELRAAAADDALACTACGRRYPIVLGIPDLRVLPDPYISLEKDRAKGRLLAEKCAGLGFEAALDAYYAMTPEVPPVQARLFKRSVLAAEARAREALAAWEPGGALPGALLEIGCGTGPMLLAARARGAAVTGIDIAFRWLVMARVRLDEAGAADVPILCASAEALPFPADTFDRVIADSVIEHVQDAHAALSEAGRVARRGGRLYATTPNRRSLGPDPHTGLPAGGWLPESWTAAYVRRKGGIPPRRHLYTRGELRRALERAGFGAVDVRAPDILPAQRRSLGAAGRAAVDAYHVLKSLPLAGRAVAAVAPLLSIRANAGGPHRTTVSAHVEPVAGR